MSAYQVILFDLDHTLWDYETNSVETLRDLYHHYDLPGRAATSITFDHFMDTFNTVNDGLWNNYNKGHIDRDVIKNRRFKDILATYEVKDEALCTSLSADYISMCPTKTALFPHTHDVLQHLGARYDLYILTNGFNDVQNIKLDHSGLRPYFKGMITSETCGHRKPSMEIFKYALTTAQAQAHQALMIGDNLKADILGAHKVSIDTVYFNPKAHTHKQQPTYEIRCLSELTKLL